MTSASRHFGPLTIIRSPRATSLFIGGMQIVVARRFFAIGLGGFEPAWWSVGRVPW